jgi:hypothetical protein
MLTDKGPFSTSAVAMLEIAKAQLPTTSDKLQLAPHSPAPEDLGRENPKPKDPVIPQTGGKQGSATPIPLAPPIHSSGVSPLGEAKSGSRTGTREDYASRQHTSPAVHRHLSTILSLLGTGADKLEVIHGTTDDALKILEVLHTAHRMIKRVSLGAGSTITKITYAQLRRGARYGRYAEKASTYMEAIDQIHTFGKNVHSILPIANSIINRDQPLGTKLGKLGTLLGAVSLSTVAQIELAPMRTGIASLRWAAAVAGADVMHPKFADYGPYNPCAYLNWQFADFIETRSVSAFDANNVYLFLHSRIDHS